MLKSCFIVVLSVFLNLAATSQIQNQNLDFQSVLKERGEVHFRFEAPGNDILPLITKMISIDRRANEDGFLYAYANRKQFLEFLKLQIDYEILSAPGIKPDISMLSQVNVKEIDEWDFYPTYEAYIDMMYQFQDDYPGLCNIINIGQSLEGRDLLVARISDNVGLDEGEPRFLYTSSIHGDELTAYVLMLRLIDYLLSHYGIEENSNSKVDELVNKLDIYINPLSNPDGTYFGGNNTVNGAKRFNANNIDLNRNYPDPQDGQHPDGNAWQPETEVFMQFAEDYQFYMSANFHGGAEVFNYPWDTWPQLSPQDDWWQFVGHEWADTAQHFSPSGYMSGFNDGITNGNAWYEIDGGRQDYMNYFRDCLETTVEISNTKLPSANQLPDFWEYNYHSFLNYMKHAIQENSIEENHFNAYFNISPNPSNGYFELNYIADIHDNIKLIVSNSLGGVVYKKNLKITPGESKFTIDLNGFPHGVYIVRIEKDNRFYTKKIFKN